MSLLLLSGSGIAVTPVVVSGAPVASRSTASSSTLQLGDLALVWGDLDRDADLVMVDSDLGSDTGVATAVLLSLFTDRRALVDDVSPSGDVNDRRGWWADQFGAVEGDRIGSRLWLLDRSTRTNEVAIRAREYVREALAWMLDDRVAETVDVQVETASTGLLISVTLQRPGRDPVSLRFAHVWDGIAPAALAVTGG